MSEHHKLIKGTYGSIHLDGSKEQRVRKRLRKTMQAQEDGIHRSQIREIASYKRLKCLGYHKGIVENVEIRVKDDDDDDEDEDVTGKEESSDEDEDEDESKAKGAIEEVDEDIDKKKMNAHEVENDDDSKEEKYPLTKNKTKDATATKSPSLKEDAQPIEISAKQKAIHESHLQISETIDQQQHTQQQQQQQQKNEDEKKNERDTKESPPKPQRNKYKSRIELDMPLYSCDLLLYIEHTQKHNQPACVHIIVSLLFQMLNAVISTRDAGIMHRDLKPDNFLVQRNIVGDTESTTTPTSTTPSKKKKKDSEKFESFMYGHCKCSARHTAWHPTEVRLCDFGLATFLSAQPTAVMSCVIQSVLYRAPEFFSSSSSSSSSPIDSPIASSHTFSSSHTSSSASSSEPLHLSSFLSTSLLKENEVLYTDAIEVWSIGCIVYQLVCNESLPHCYKCVVAAQKNVAITPVNIFECPHQNTVAKLHKGIETALCIPDSLKNLIKQMLCVLPKHRITLVHARSTLSTIITTLYTHSLVSLSSKENQEIIKVIKSTHKLPLSASSPSPSPSLSPSPSSLSLLLSQSSSLTPPVVVTPVSLAIDSGMSSSNFSVVLAPPPPPPSLSSIDSNKSFVTKQLHLNKHRQFHAKIFEYKYVWNSGVDFMVNASYSKFGVVNLEPEHRTRVMEWLDQVATAMYLQHKKATYDDSERKGDDLATQPTTSRHTKTETVQNQKEDTEAPEEIKKNMYNPENAEKHNERQKQEEEEEEETKDKTKDKTKDAKTSFISITFRVEMLRVFFLTCYLFDIVLDRSPPTRENIQYVAAVCFILASKAVGGLRRISFSEINAVAGGIFDITRFYDLEHHIFVHVLRGHIWYATEFDAMQVEYDGRGYNYASPLVASSSSSSSTSLSENSPFSSSSSLSPSSLSASDSLSSSPLASLRTSLGVTTSPMTSLPLSFSSDETVQSPSISSSSSPSSSSVSPSLSNPRALTCSESLSPSPALSLTSSPSSSHSSYPSSLMSSSLEFLDDLTSSTTLAKLNNIDSQICWNYACNALVLAMFDIRIRTLTPTILAARILDVVEQNYSTYMDLSEVALQTLLLR